MCSGVAICKFAWYVSPCSSVFTYVTTCVENLTLEPENMHDVDKRHNVAFINLEIQAIVCTTLLDGKCICAQLRRDACTQTHVMYLALDQHVAKISSGRILIVFY